MTGGQLGKKVNIGSYGEHIWDFVIYVCPECVKETIFLSGTNLDSFEDDSKAIMAYPQKGEKEVAPPNVPEDLAEDFNEASMVISSSSKAAATLARRALHNLLVMEGITNDEENLSNAINDAIFSSEIPLYLKKNIDAFRELGNFGAHTRKDSHYKEIINVEYEEADWSLDLLKQLFEFFYEEKEKAKKIRGKLDEKLEQAGKKGLKTPGPDSNEGKESKNE